MNLRPLLSGLFDYAGLFPPAGLPLAEVAANYAAERAGPDAWALARLILPATRLSELGASGALAAPARPWPISALLGSDLGADLMAIDDFNDLHAGRAFVDAVELRLADAGPLLSGELTLPPGLIGYVELPAGDHAARTLGRLAELGLRAKLRCGGVSAEAFPAPAELAHMLLACAAARVPFKATAGLHHPLRGDYRLTYAADSSRAPMYGFLNLLLATAAARAGATSALVADLLLEQDRAALRWDDDGLSWRELRLSAGRLADMRARGMIAIGSCSFREPLDEVTQLYGVL